MFGCPASRVGEDRDLAEGIVWLVFTWVGTVLAFVSFVPMVFMEGFLEFPKYLLPLIVVFFFFVFYFFLFFLFFFIFIFISIFSFTFYSYFCS